MEEFKNKYFIFGNLCFLLAILACDIVFIVGVAPIYLIKTLSSALFVVQGIYNFALALKFKGKSALKTLVLLIGLAFAFTGDVLLIDHFIAGAIFFAVGHIFFLVYFFMLQKLSFSDALVFVGLSLFALLLIFLYKGFVFNGMQFLVIGYAIIICTMLSKAIGNMITRPTLVNLFVMLGAFLFFFSDLMLLFYRFASHAKVFDILCLISYYPAEILLAASVFLTAKKPEVLTQGETAAKAEIPPIEKEPNDKTAETTQETSPKEPEIAKNEPKSSKKTIRYRKKPQNNKKSQ